ncbi:MAG: type II secretion system protein [Phycisphaerae bacterium]
MTKDRYRGFTLIELLVVVSIIALLMAILLPSLKGARRQAKQVVCAARLRSIGQGLWNYWTENNGRVPYVESSMTNGGFGDPAKPDEETNPYDRDLWPGSLPNTLTPTYMGSDEKVFVCPSAIVGWPRQQKPFRMTYRPAAVNQPNGIVDATAEYFREHFGFMDGRVFKPPTQKLTYNPITDAINSATVRGTFLRDMVKVVKNRVVGPHRGGNNVINKRLEVEFRNQKRTNEDLAPFGQTVQF